MSYSISSIRGESKENIRILEQLCATVDFENFQTPSPSVKVISDECIYSCDRRTSPKGLFMNLKTFQTVGWDFLQLDRRLHSCDTFLNIHDQYITTKLPNKGNFEECMSQADSIQTGDIPLITTVTIYSLYFAESRTLFEIGTSNKLCSKEESYHSPIYEWLKKTLPDKFLKIIQVVLAGDAAGVDNPSILSLQEPLQESKYAKNLKQVENPVRITFRNRKCERCGRESNLWLNLTDGFIGCGRKLFGIPQSGCLDNSEGAAILHYQEDPANRPLAVKLGSITPNSAEVYSYPEDCFVRDPEIEAHLQTFGIDIRMATKTEKTLRELQLDYNANFNLEQNANGRGGLKHLCKKGYVGLINFGNTCYMNATIQLLSSVSRIAEQWNVETHNKLLSRLNKSSDVSNNLLIQFCKLIVGITSDRYFDQRQMLLDSMSPEVREIYLREFPCEVISPGLFRSVVVKGHPEFSSSRQHDVEEFLRYFFEKIINSIGRDGGDYLNDHFSCESVFRFEVEELLKTEGTNNVRTCVLWESILSVPVGTNFADQFCPDTGISNVSELSTEHDPLHKYSFDKCLSDWAAGEEFEFLDHTKDKIIQGRKTRKIKSFPDFMLIQLKRFYFDKEWVPKKIVSPVEMPFLVDFSQYKASETHSSELHNQQDSNFQENIEQIYEIGIDNDVFSTLKGMGFEDQVIRDAWSNLGHTDIGSYVDWIFSHSKPAASQVYPAPRLQADSEKCNDSSSHPLENLKEKVNRLELSIGLGKKQILAGLISNEGDENKAVEWLLENNPSDRECDEIANNWHSYSFKGTKEEATKDIESTRYKLKGFIEHIGPHAAKGHFVYYSYDEEGNCAVYNDTKVSYCDSAPLNQGYLYIYEKIKKCDQ